MRTEYIFLSTFAALSLSACGGSNLNAKNADTFQSSMTKMLKGLSEQDRRKVGAGIFLMTDYSKVGDARLGKLFKAQGDAKYLVTPSNENEFMANRSGLIGEMIVKSEGRLDGKSANAFIDFYDQSINAASDNDIETQNKLLVQLDSEEADLNKSVKDYALKKTSLQKKHMALLVEGNAYLNGVSYSKFSMATTSQGSHGHYVNMKVHIDFTLKNSGKSPIMRPTLVVEIREKGKPNLLAARRYEHYYNKQITPGSRKSISGFYINDQFQVPKNVSLNLPKVLGAYDLKTYLANVQIEAHLPGRKYKELSVAGDDWVFLFEGGYEKKVEECTKVGTGLAAFRGQVAARVEKLKKRELENLGRVNRRGNFKC